MIERTKPGQSEAPVFRDLSLIGGHPSLDLLNTVKYRGAAEPHDRLVRFDDVVQWARTAKLISRSEAIKLGRIPKHSAHASRAHRQICEFREHARILFERSKNSSGDYLAAIAAIETAVTKLRHAVFVDKDTGILSKTIVVKKPKDLRDRIVESVAEILSYRRDFTIKTCNGTDCDWVFVDKTKAHHRQWCDSRTCGNTARVRRFREARQT